MSYLWRFALIVFCFWLGNRAANSNRGWARISDLIFLGGGIVVCIFICVYATVTGKSPF